MLTIGDYSYAILKTEKDRYFLFDSHGYFPDYHGNAVKQKGGYFRFSRRQDLEEFLVYYRGPQTLGVIAEIEITEHLADTLSAHEPDVVEGTKEEIETDNTGQGDHIPQVRYNRSG